jgi:hypothetical protein
MAKKKAAAVPEGDKELANLPISKSVQPAIQAAHEFAAYVERFKIADLASAETLVAAINAQKDFLKSNPALKQVRELKAGAHKQHAWFSALERLMTTPREEAITAGNEKVIAFKKKEDRKAQLAAARKLAKAGDEEMAHRLAQYDELKAAGEQDAADAILAEPIEASGSARAAEVRIAGHSERDNWKAEVIDLPAFEADVVRLTKKIPGYANLLAPAESEINALARSQKGLLRIKGLRVYNATVAAKSRG